MVQFLELITISILQARALIRTEEGPVTIVLYTFHEQIRRPKSVEQITSTHFFLTVVLAQVKELNEVRMPWFEIDGDRTLSLTATLVDVSCCIVANRYTGLCTSRCFSCKSRPSQLAEPTLRPAMASDMSDKPEPPAEVDGGGATAIGSDQNPMLPSYDPL